MSITNAVEDIASQLCDQLAIPPAKLILVQHYEMQLMSHPEWSWVRFKASDPHSPLQDPEWKTMSSHDWHALGLKPPPRRKTSKRDRRPFILELL